MTPIDQFNSHSRHARWLPSSAASVPTRPRASAMRCSRRGIRIIGVPLNSPDPLDTIVPMAARFGEWWRSVPAPCSIGKTLRGLETRQDASSSRPMRTPVIGAAVVAGLVSAPGCFTPTGAFAARWRAGAQAVPGRGDEPCRPQGAARRVAKDVPMRMVGGISPDAMRDCLAAGARALGLGSGLYSPGRSAGDVADARGRMSPRWRSDTA
jgi:2-dehydro-3-deoxyphosphogalactonate aldolase